MSKEYSFLKRLTKVDDSLTITLCENGYVADVRGSDSNDDWISSKIVFDSLDDLVDFIAKISKLEKR